MVSKAQLRRDKIAILRVLPEDGTPMTMADVLLRAGEQLYPAMLELVEDGRVSPFPMGHLHGYRRVIADVGGHLG